MLLEEEEEDEDENPKDSTSEVKQLAKGRMALPDDNEDDVDAEVADNGIPGDNRGNNNSEEEVQEEAAEAQVEEAKET